MFSGSKVLFSSMKRVSDFPCSKLKFCNSHSPAWSQTGQSKGWLINKNSVTDFLASVTLSEFLLFTSIPSIHPVTHDAINFGMGLGSASLPFATSTKQQRHFPPLPFNLE